MIMTVFFINLLSDWNKCIACRAFSYYDFYGGLNEEKGRGLIYGEICTKSVFARSAKGDAKIRWRKQIACLATFEFSSSCMLAIQAPKNTNSITARTYRLLPFFVILTIKILKKGIFVMYSISFVAIHTINYPLNKS